MNLKTWLEQTGNTQQRLVELLAAEGVTITQGAISQWLTKDRVPADRCLLLQKVSNGQMTVYALRPDIFGPSEKAA